MVGILRRVGLNSEMLYGAAMASIFGSIGAWATAKSAADKPSAQRWGIFVGLWAPTFMELGNALRMDERR